MKKDTDLVGAYLKKQKETQRRIEYNINYRQEHSVMFLDGIAPTEAALISKLDLYKAKDNNEKIKKCEGKIISDMLPNDSREYFIVYFDTITEEEINEFQERYHNAKNILETGTVMADMVKRSWSVRYNNARSNYIIGTGGNPVAEGAGNLAKIGDEFGKLGKLVKNPGIKADWANTTTHGLERMAERGVTQGMVDYWV